jgi:hypothetical protein
MARPGPGLSQNTIGCGDAAPSPTPRQLNSVQSSG